MSEQLTGLKSEYTDKLRRLKLLEAGVDYGEIDTYIKYLSADKSDEIEKQAAELVADIEQKSNFGDAYCDDKKVWNPFKIKGEDEI
ncbi:hypothetical protein J8TS2_24110 [Lederbergia ruris]|uniref:Uncharacterized protein n=1 Tax=Lederbergia ruris TaxID=217495 RepID=A0ABQ4KJF3_9BACI|nr:hypothetical protein [Lederbergia ruris]GIN58092.1 hypothetical protein J8TS2_24110 [Lederbergia ruris]